MLSINRRFFTFAALAGAFAITAISASFQPVLADDKVRLGALRLGSHAPSFVAYERGYFTEEGLEVEFVFFDAAQPMAVAIASGDVDFGLTAITGGLINLANRGAVKVIGGALQEEPGIEGQVILASKAAYDAGLDAPEKLGGHSFGITQAGSSFHYIAHKIAEKAGFPADEIRLVNLQNVGATIGALRTAQIDAWAIVPNVGKPLAGSDEVEQIGWVADYIPDYQVTTVFTSTDIVNNRREVAERFLRAFSKGIADYNAALVDRTAGADEEEAITRIIAQYIAADQPYERASVSIINGAMRINENAKMNLTNIKDQLQWFQDEGLVGTDITIETVVDTSFVETY